VTFPVVVVGAGLSGLFASQLLARADECVLLIEAHDRLGGWLGKPKVRVRPRASPTRATWRRAEAGWCSVGKIARSPGTA
jgi:2-polyprenyl-6-methoxyphenol hydroxylase-like FAD-dependent oxidoreductase